MLTPIPPPDESGAILDHNPQAERRHDFAPRPHAPDNDATGLRAMISETRQMAGSLLHLLKNIESALRESEGDGR